MTRDINLEKNRFKQLAILMDTDGLQEPAEGVAIAASQRLGFIRSRLWEDWARHNGFERDWIPCFSLDALSISVDAGSRRAFPMYPTEMDSAEYYVDNKGQLSAVVVHLYGPLARLRAPRIAKQFNIAVHFPPNPKASWHDPGKCFLVVFTPLGETVEWLKEQCLDPDQ